MLEPLRTHCRVSGTLFTARTVDIYLQYSSNKLSVSLKCSMVFIFLAE